VKSDPVRKKIIKMLKENILKILSSFWYDFSLTALWDVLELEVKGEFDRQELQKRLQKIFWISYILVVKEESFDTKEDILPFIEQYFFPELVGKKFFVRVKRVGKHSFSSQELERFIGAHILKNVEWVSVDLKNADVLVQIEIKDQKVFFIQQKLTGAWGYPTGFSGKVLSMISWWFDSTVSTYMSMKRGLEVDFLFFDLWFTPQTLGVKQVSYYLWKEYERSYFARFIQVDFSFLIAFLLEKTTPKFRSVLLKRYMLKTTHILNEYLEQKYSFFKKPYQAVVKWDSIAQVSSQTLANLTQIDQATGMLVLRPLIMFDKQEIIDISRKIGTFEFAHNMPEYCWVVSDNPSTQATFDEIQAEEAKIEEAFFSQIFEKIQIKKMENILDDEENLDYTGEIVSELQDWILIDIREPEKILKHPLSNISEKLEIPFYKINNEFAKLDQSKKYYLYCEKGTLSKLHAMYLQEKWFQNVSVIRFDKKS
jgi:thiamine biosynthesis protein ThiI